MRTFPGSIGAAWLAGEVTTTQLHEHMSGDEYLHHLKEDWWGEIFDKWYHLQFDGPWIPLTELCKNT